MQGCKVPRMQECQFQGEPVTHSLARFHYCSPLVDHPRGTGTGSEIELKSTVQA